MNKQVIVVRKDLKMSKGKIAGQVSHACMKVFFDRMRIADINYFRQIIEANLTQAMIDWIDWKEGEEGFTKIVAACESEEELFWIQEQAEQKNIPNAIILDNTLTKERGEKTYTCICLGPFEETVIDEITRKYPLL